jgi:hypothetical protein
MSVKEQFDERTLKYNIGNDTYQKNNIIESLKRIEIFEEYKNLSPSTVTVWPKNFAFIPNLSNILQGRYYLCAIRKNKVEQILSRLLTHYNCNYNNEEPSFAVKVDLALVNFYCQELVKTESHQHTIVSRGLGQYVDFDELINGKADIGFNYKISSTDQHTDLTKLILNLDNVLTQIHNKLNK